MHDNAEPKDVPEESAPEEQEPQQAGGSEEPAASEPKEEEGQDEGQPGEDLPPPGGAPWDCTPISKEQQEMLVKAAKMLSDGLLRLFTGRRSPPQHFPLPPAELTMPRDVAHRLLLELYRPRKQQSNRPFRVGMGLGAMINMMGMQVLSEDLVHMLADLFNRDDKGPDLRDLIRHIGVPHGVNPPKFGQHDFDPIENLEMPPGSQHFPGGIPVDPRAMEDWGRWVRAQQAEPMRASGEGLGFAGIPPMENIGPEMKEEAERRWERLQGEQPEKAEEMKAAGFDLAEVFEHFEELFGDFFPKHEPADPAPDGGGEPPADQS